MSQNAQKTSQIVEENHIICTFQLLVLKQKLSIFRHKMLCKPGDKPKLAQSVKYAHLIHKDLI